MTAKERNDYFYVCALIEYIAVSYTHLTLPTIA